MASTGIFNGTNLLVTVEGTAIGHTTSCSLSISHDLPESTTKDSAGWSEVISGTRSGEVSFDGLVMYNDSNDNVIELIDYVINRTQVTVVFGTSESGDTIYTAEGYVASVEQSADMEAPVSYSGTITLTGAIEKSTNA